MMTIKKELPKNIAVINGPNLHLLGMREPDKYGSLTLTDINENLLKLAKSHNQANELSFFQSNIEGEIVSHISSLKLTPQNHFPNGQTPDGIIINAGAYTHTSIAIRDTLLATSFKFVEVHLSNVHAREEFRHKSYLADVAVGVIAGLQDKSYSLALEYFLSQ